MFSADVSQVIVAMAESWLPRGNPNQALYVPLELKLGNREAGTQTMSLVFLLYRPKAHTLVAARFDSLLASRNRPVESFSLKAYHDSGWREDGVGGVVKEAYRALAGELSPTTKRLFAQATFIGRGELGTHPVDEVEFDATDYDKPVVVKWRQVGQNNC